jgi:hypothetical protein
MDNYDEKTATKLAQEMSDDDKREYKKMGRNTASKAVIGSIARLLRKFGKDIFADNLMKESHKASQSLSIEFDSDGKGFKFCSCLAPVDETYRTTIDIPTGFDKLNDVVEHITLLKLIAITYLESFKVEHAKLYKRIKKVIGRDLEFAEVEDNNSTLQFVGFDDYRVSVFCYFTDMNNVALIKRATVVETIIPQIEDITDTVAELNAVASTAYDVNASYIE